ncbi:hypothetical protein H7Y63_01060 [Polaromonas sp.]|nr:hypothetical protein [Candidatus Saccharibacteria bacterium]
MKTIFLFGDSITYGSWDMVSSGWASRLRNHLDLINKSPTYYLYALGIPGETSGGLRARFEPEFLARQRSDDDSYTIVLACGANDATWLNGEGRFKVSKEDYITNMRAVIRQAKQYTKDIYSLNITPVNEKFSAEFKGKDKKCMNEYVNTYNLALSELCEVENVEIIDIHSVFKDLGANDLLTTDGLHPNAGGHEVIADTVISKLVVS